MWEFDSRVDISTHTHVYIHRASPSLIASSTYTFCHLAIYPSSLFCLYVLCLLYIYNAAIFIFLLLSLSLIFYIIPPYHPSPSSSLWLYIHREIADDTRPENRIAIPSAGKQHTKKRGTLEDRNRLAPLSFSFTCRVYHENEADSGRTISTESIHSISLLSLNSFLFCLLRRLQAI